MTVVQEKFASIAIASGELLISDRYDLSAGVRIENVPDELDVQLVLRQDANFTVISGIVIKSSQTTEQHGRARIAVDTGWLYLGDSRMSERGEVKVPLATVVEAAFDRVTDTEPLRSVVFDSAGRCRGVICASGIGDGEYYVTWGMCGNVWQLRIDFL